MSGEYYTANTIEEAKEKLRQLYQSDSEFFEEIDVQKYQAIDRSERIDSDNHINLDRLRKGETAATDEAYYKYLPDRKVAYHIMYRDKNGREEHEYFIRTPKA